MLMEKGGGNRMSRSLARTWAPSTRKIGSTV